MSPIQIRYKNKKFTKERIELDGHAYEHCDFEGCLIVLEKGRRRSTPVLFMIAASCF